MDIERDKEISKLKRQFNKLLKQIPEDKKPIGQSLIKELTFMALTLDDLKIQVEEGGTVEMFKQGRR